MKFNITDNITSPDQLVTALFDNFPYLGALILFVIFLLITLVGYFAATSRNENVRLQNWLMVASFVTTAISFIMFLIPGMVNITIVVTCFTFFVGFTFWALMTD